MLDSAMPYYQVGLGNRLYHELTLNDCNRVIKSAIAIPDAKYRITDISLEYEIVTQPKIARDISVLLYDRVLRHREIKVNKSDTTWSWLFVTLLQII